MFRYNPSDETAFVDAETAFGSVFDDDDVFGADDDAGIEASLQDLEDELDLDDETFGEVREVVKEKLAHTAEMLKGAFVDAKDLAKRELGFGDWMAMDANVDVSKVFDIIKASLGVADWVVSDDEIKELADVFSKMVEEWGYGFPISRRGHDAHRLLQRLCLYETLGEQAVIDDNLLNYWEGKVKEWKASTGFLAKAKTLLTAGPGAIYTFFDGFFKDFANVMTAAIPMSDRQLFNSAAGILLVWEVAGGLEELLERQVRDWLPAGWSQKDYTVLQTMVKALTTKGPDGRMAVEVVPGTSHPVALRPGGVIPPTFAPEPSPDLVRPPATYEPTPAEGGASPYYDIPVASEGGGDYVPMILAAGIAWTMLSN